jgi:dephospho-CoA kinase
MYIIGLTGGIASGKSTVSAMLAELGACIVDADKIARDIVAPKQPAWQEIVARFGDEIILADGSMNRALLGEIVFKDQSERAWLENITHPYIRSQMQDDINKAQDRGCAIVILDVPLLIESGWQSQTDEVWVVYVEEQVQLSRLMSRNGLSAAQAMARVKAQMSLNEKIQYADVVIDNNKDIHEVRSQVNKLWYELSKKVGLQ